MGPQSRRPLQDGHLRRTDHYRLALRADARIRQSAKRSIFPAGVEGTPPSRINLHTGEQIRVRDLLKAVLVGSANDAARALAIAAAGSEWSFVSRMNEKAAQIGMRHTRFMNASGLPVDNHYTTAADLILLMKAAQQNEFIVRALNAKYVVVQTLGGRMIRLKNHNRMLWRGPSEIIGKTGWTRSSDHCFVGRIRFGSKSAYVAIMGSRNKWNDLAALAGRYLGAKSSGTQKSSRYDTRSVQRALRKAGYFDREPTGFFGPITKNALIQFQKAHNLKPDGVVGPKTWKVLQKYL